MIVDVLGADDSILARLFDAALGTACAKISKPPAPCPGPVYIAFRRAGTLCFSTWRDDLDLVEALAKAQRAARRKKLYRGIDTVEVCLTHDYQAVEQGNIPKRFGNVHRGVFGIEMRVGTRMKRFAPTEMIARNLSFEKAFERFLTSVDMSQKAFLDAGGVFRRFRARQFLAYPGNTTRVVSLYRGARLVTPEEITAATVRDMIDELGGWLLRNLSPSGRMTYKYWPSRDEEPVANNPIRQFMATICLGRLARYTGARATAAAAKSNLGFNLELFFKPWNGVGVIDHRGQAKLGAAALAALAIHELDARQDYPDIFRQLSDGIEALAQDDGAFRTFHYPAHRNDNQNFYSGEALLFWATRLLTEKNTQLLNKCRRGFDYYRKWHRVRRNPAFIPWHTQVNALLFEATADPEFAEFVFEMNDWLLPMQQWDEVNYDDLRGRFYDPQHPEYGPPHASSTGVYLEGLADALGLAMDLGQEERAQVYRRAVWRGLRSLRQLEFVDDADMFYIRNKDKARNGLRTEAYDNAIRVDNVQHGLLALLKLANRPALLEPVREAPSKTETILCRAGSSA